MICFFAAKFSILILHLFTYQWLHYIWLRPSCSISHLVTWLNWVKADSELLHVVDYEGIEYLNVEMNS